jgi:peptidoglycan/xylan/chitin deacetylase (PgdA/CDA1 family)
MTVLLATAVATPPAGASGNGGYRFVAADGGVFTFGDDAFYGSTGGMRLNQPIVGMAPTPSGRGYWLVASDGGIFAFGDATFFGSTGGVRLNQPIVGMAATPSGNGYWLVASDGGIFAFGDAAFHGSTGALRLNAPIVGMASTPSGSGYWLVAIDGGMFAFGDAVFYGTDVRAGNPPVVGVASSPSGHGYLLVNAAGTVNAFGDAPALGSIKANVGDPVVGIAETENGAGYWLVTRSGAATPFGDAPAIGSLTSGLAAPVIGISGPGRGSSGFAYTLFAGWLSRGGADRAWPGPRQVALTFDDGPNPPFTPEVLDALDRAGVPATFFMVGIGVERSPAAAAQVVQRGHSVAVHSWKHDRLNRMPTAAVTDDLRRTADSIERATGVRPTCFRPPYGETSPGVVNAAAALGQRQVLWNVDTEDWRGKSIPEIIDATNANADGRPLVILMHDGGGERSRTVASIQATVDGLRARGYEFVRLCG